MNDDIRNVLDQLPKARRDFELTVEAIAHEVVGIARNISPAIGEVSIIEAKQAIIREFTERLKNA